MNKALAKQAAHDGPLPQTASVAWIASADQLPPMDVPVWGVLEGDFPCVAKRWPDEEGWYWAIKHSSDPYSFDPDKQHNITHWIPKPVLDTPPKKAVEMSSAVAPTDAARPAHASARPALPGAAGHGRRCPIAERQCGGAGNNLGCPPAPRNPDDGTAWGLSRA